MMEERTSNDGVKSDIPGSPDRSNKRGKAKKNSSKKSTTKSKSKKSVSGAAESSSSTTNDKKKKHLQHHSEDVDTNGKVLVQAGEKVEAKRLNQDNKGNKTNLMSIDKEKKLASETDPTRQKRTKEKIKSSSNRNKNTTAGQEVSGSLNQNLQQSKAQYRHTSSSSMPEVASDFTHQPGAIRVTVIQDENHPQNQPLAAVVEENGEPSSEHIIQAELVDEAAIQKQALKTLVIDASAELMDDEEVKERVKRRKRRQQNEKTGLSAMFTSPNRLAVMACGVALLALIAVARPSTSAPSTPDIFEQPQQPTQAPTSAIRQPTFAPTNPPTSTAPTTNRPGCTINVEPQQGMSGSPSTWSAIDFVNSFPNVDASYVNNEFSCTGAFCGLDNDQWTLEIMDCPVVGCPEAFSCEGYAISGSEQVQCGQEGCIRTVTQISGASPHVDCVGVNACWQGTISMVSDSISEEPRLICSGSSSCRQARINLGTDSGVVVCSGGRDNNRPACHDNMRITGRCLVCLESDDEQGCQSGQISLNGVSVIVPENTSGYCGDCSGVDAADGLDSICV